MPMFSAEDYAALNGVPAIHEGWRLVPSRAAQPVPGPRPVAPKLLAMYPRSATEHPTRTVQGLIRAVALGVWARCLPYVRGNDFSALKQNRQADCYYVHLDDVAPMLLNHGLGPVFLQKGHVKFNGLDPYEPYANFHAWISIPGVASVLDFTVGPQLAAGGRINGASIAAYLPVVIENGYTFKGLVYTPDLERYSITKTPRGGISCV